MLMSKHSAVAKPGTDGTFPRSSNSQRMRNSQNAETFRLSPGLFCEPQQVFPGASEIGLQDKGLAIGRFSPFAVAFSFERNSEIQPRQRLIGIHAGGFREQAQRIVETLHPRVEYGKAVEQRGVVR